MANWEELPQEILELIAGRLAIVDFPAFGAVSTSWRSAARKVTYNPKSKVPWLMIAMDGQVGKFFITSRRTIHQAQWPGYQAQTLSPPGWVLVSNSPNEHCIYNPLSSVSIKLPTLENLRHKSRLPRMGKIALSSSPSLSRSYTVMISIQRGPGPPGLAFHRSGEDGWTVVTSAEPPPWSNVLQLIYYDGLFVALDAHNQIMTLDERENRMQLRLVLGQRYEDSPYLVECCGSLLVVWVSGYRNNVRFTVFEVDLKKGTQKEVKSLGNASLFLNNNSSFSVEFNADACHPWIKPNFIYFADPEHKTIYCHSMEDGKLKTYWHASFVVLNEAKWIQPGF